MMPKGVEHLYCAAKGQHSNSVKIPRMPKGVEHC